MNEGIYYLGSSREQEQHNRNIAFQAYLDLFQLSWLDVALLAEVRLITVWNIDHNIPVHPYCAAKVRAALKRLTGVTYSARIAVFSTFE